MKNLKNKLKGFLQRIFARNNEKKILGTSDTLVNETIVPLNQRIIMKIVGFYNKLAILKVRSDTTVYRKFQGQ